MTIEEVANSIWRNLEAAVGPGVVSVGIADDKIMVYEHRRIPAEVRGQKTYTHPSGFKIVHKYVGKTRPTTVKKTFEPAYSKANTPTEHAPGPLTDAQKANFVTLQRAERNKDLAIVSAIRKSDRANVALIVAVQRDNNGSFSIVPLAEMINGDPYELYEDPTV